MIVWKWWWRLENTEDNDVRVGTLYLFIQYFVGKIDDKNMEMEEL